jgi:hypothetical protein
MGVKGRIKEETKERKKKRNTTKHKKIVDIGKKWLKNQSGKRWSCGVIFSELVCAGVETPDIMGFSSYGSTLIEVKVSRADFLRDKNKIVRKNPYLGMGGYRFYLSPKDIIKEKDLPEKWGLIHIDDNDKARIVVKPEYQERNLQSENAYMYSAIRRTYNKKCNEIQSFFRRYT